MTEIKIILPLSAFAFLLGIISIFALIFGIFSFIFPAMSVGLYCGIMKFFNWDVRPIDAEKEIKTTRYLAIALIFLSLILSAYVYFIYQQIL